MFFRYWRFFWYLSFSDTSSYLVLIFEYVEIMIKLRFCILRKLSFKALLWQVWIYSKCEEERCHKTEVQLYLVYIDGILLEILLQQTLSLSHYQILNFNSRNFPFGFDVWSSFFIILVLLDLSLHCKPV